MYTCTSIVAFSQYTCTHHWNILHASVFPSFVIFQRNTAFTLETNSAPACFIISLICSNIAVDSIDDEVGGVAGVAGATGADLSSAYPPLRTMLPFSTTQTCDECTIKRFNTNNYNKNYGYHYIVGKAQLSVMITKNTSRFCQNLSFWHRKWNRTVLCQIVRLYDLKLHGKYQSHSVFIYPF